jgi:transcriptional regulator GlxA family with amidase domain
MPSEVSWAWRRLAESGGLLPVTELAAEVGWSRRHLGERFRDELGLSPKVAGRVIRFGRARRLLGRPRRPGLAEVAVACGYYDQAHLTRDFHEFAGCTPGVWMEEELPSVQSTGGTSLAR